MAFGQKLKELREEQNLSRDELAQRVGLTYWTISKYETGSRTPDYKTTKKLADLFNVSTDYLLDRTNNREGAEMRVGRFEIDILETLEDSDTNVTVGDKPLSRLQRVSMLRALVNPEEVLNTIKKVPVLGTIRAGIPLLAEGQWIGEVEIPSDLEADFALKVTGDSMSWAGIHEGDIAVLRRLNVAQNGMIVAAGVEEEEWTASFKYYVEENGCKILRAANPAYEDIIIGTEHRIIGHVVALQKEPPALYTYRNIMLSKNDFDEWWEEAIQTASNYGMNGKQVKQLIELFSHMVKQNMDKR